MENKKSKLIRASLYLLITSWYGRILSILSVVILARYLDKYDFGIIATCFVVQGFFSSISNLGGNQYLIRKKCINDSDLDLAWTINFFLKFGIGIILFVSASGVSSYFSVPELEFALQVMALSPLFIGLKNPAINKKIKSLDYDRISMVTAVSKSISSTTSIMIAYFYHSYWAVIISDVVYNFFIMLGSHLIVSYRPSLRFNNINEQWDFSKWIMLKGIVSYLKFNLDRLVLTKAFSVESLGLYSFSQESASTIKNILVDPIKSILYPSLSHYISDNSEFLDKVYKSVLVFSCVYLPVVFGGTYVSEQLIPFVFSDKWLEAIPLFNIFLIMTFAGLFNEIFSSVFTLTGKVKVQFYFEVVTSFIFFAIIIYASSFDLEVFAKFRVFSVYLMLFLMMVILKLIVNISLLRVMFLIFPVVISCLIMLFSLVIVNHYIYSLPNFSYLAISISIGLLIYIVSFFIITVVIKSFFKEYEFIYDIVKFKINNRR